jgi:hypothetical protein
MNLKINIKLLTTLFSIGVAGVAVSLVMGIYTGVREYQVRTTPVPLTIPTPAVGNS